MLGPQRIKQGGPQWPHAKEIGLAALDMLRMIQLARKPLPGGIEDRVKIIHTDDLCAWTRFPEYRHYDGLTLGEYKARRHAVETVLFEFRDFIRARKRLAELDVDTPLEYVRHNVPVPGSVRPGEIEIVLPKPDHPESTVTCDGGAVSGQVLRLPRTWRKRTVTVRYSCPSRVINSREIAKLNDTLSMADHQTCARLAAAEASPYRQPVLFISHRWEARHHPDPEGRQLTKLQTLKNCFLIYDYSSFPQSATTPEDEKALLEILSGMNALISNVVILTAPDFLERGWCIYEYVVSSMRSSIVCDELNAPNFVTLRNLAATNPPESPRLLGHSIESGIQNAKNQKTLETISTILPLFNQSKFTMERDREVVRDLLVSELKRMLPRKKEYQQYLGEWTTKAWTKEELQAAFTGGLRWKAEFQYFDLKPFEPNVPSTLADAAVAKYRLDKMPAQNDFTWATLTGVSPWEGLASLFMAIGKGILIALGIWAGIMLVVLVLLVLLIKWIFF